MTYLTALAFIVVVAILITLIYAAVFARIRK
jgi:sensor histidine kinase regulating citrate/malate metabolism